MLPWTEGQASSSPSLIWPVNQYFLFPHFAQSHLVHKPQHPSLVILGALSNLMTESRLLLPGKALACPSALCVINVCNNSS